MKRKKLRIIRIINFYSKTDNELFLSKVLLVISNLMLWVPITIPSPNENDTTIITFYHFNTNPRFSPCFTDYHYGKENVNIVKKGR